MTRLFIGLFSLIFGSQVFAEGALAPDVQSVIDGLRPANAFKGDPTWNLEDRMAHYGVPGVGIAVVQNSEVIWHEVFGLADRQAEAPVTRDTLFQAGSISKPVSAYAALKMVEQGDLSLDAPVNDLLESWKIPDNEFTEQTQVTLTHLTSHTGGLTVHGFPGYSVGAPVPSVVEVLNGRPPANTPAVRVNQKPGEGWRYSGGGYTVMQQLMIDVADEEFPALMQNLVFEPLAMERSTFEQPLPSEKLKFAAAGVLPDRSDVAGKRHTYPEMAAAGLWTTAHDLAVFAIDVQRALDGEGQVLSQAMATAMLEPVAPGFGRGFALSTRSGHEYFEHGGWDEGFCAQLTVSRDTGVGVAVMINSNHPAFIAEVVRAVAAVYNWPGYEEYVRQPVPERAFTDFVGTYRYDDDVNLTVSAEEGGLFMQYPDEAPQELLHVGDNIFVRRERATPITFTARDGSIVFEFIIDDNQRQMHERVGD